MLVCFFKYGDPENAEDRRATKNKKRRTKKEVFAGSFSNDYGEYIEDGKKAIGLDWKNNNSARASRFFVHFFAAVA